MMRAVGWPLPREYANKRGRPLAVVVHPTFCYDPKATAAAAIRKTVASGKHHFNFLEITQVGTKSYLGLPEHLTSSAPYYGVMLDKQFLQTHKDLFKTNTFIFMGGAAERCLLNAIVSVLIAKLTPLEKLFARHRTIQDLTHPAYVSAREAFSAAVGADKSIELDLHLNCDAMYYKPSDYAKYSSWRLNRPNVILGSLLRSLRKFLLKYGITMQEHINGKKIPPPVSKTQSTSARVNLYYWNNTGQMEDFFKED